MPRSSRLTAYPAQNARTVMRAPSRESGFVHGSKPEILQLPGSGQLSPE
ncbi:MAG: hypothetical protein QOD29_4448 [Alphaproteobacteria bacterium]|nr:hypothetical protein [Alphaproteobacteria bacterium]